MGGFPCQVLTRRAQLMLKGEIKDEKRQEKENKKLEKERAVASPARVGRGRGRGRGRGLGKPQPPEGDAEAAASVAEPAGRKRARTVGAHLEARGLAEATPKRRKMDALDSDIDLEDREVDEALMGGPSAVHVPEPKAKGKAKARAKSRVKVAGNSKAKSSPKAKAKAKARARRAPAPVQLTDWDEARVRVAEQAIDAMILKCADMAFDTLKDTLIASRKVNPKFELNVYWTRATVGLKMPEVPMKPQVVQFHFVGDTNVSGSWNARMVTAFVVAHELVPWLQ